MSRFVLLTDSSADLPWDYYREHRVDYLPFIVTIDEESYTDDGTASAKNFFDKLGNGSVATTSQITQGRFLEFFEPYLQQGLDIIYVGLALGLSSTHSSACLARDELLAKYPERRIETPEAGCVSLGLGLLIDLLRRKRDAGESLDALAAYVQDAHLHIQHRFTVDDLMFLHRGGRVSRTSAVVGSLLGIKPLLHVSQEGKLLNHGKARGRKQSLLQMVEDAVSYTESGTLDSVFISHGGCEEDAWFVIEEMKKVFEIGNVIVHPLGATIGAHAGKGTVAMFFQGKSRRDTDPIDIPAK